MYRWSSAVDLGQLISNQIELLLNKESFKHILFENIEKMRKINKTTSKKTLILVQQKKQQNISWKHVKTVVEQIRQI